MTTIRQAVDNSIISMIAIVMTVAFVNVLTVDGFRLFLVTTLVVPIGWVSRKFKGHNEAIHRKTSNYAVPGS